MARKKAATVKAKHRILYGAGKTAMPGEEIELTRDNFPGEQDEIDRLIVLGAVEPPVFPNAETAE